MPFIFEKNKEIPDLILIEAKCFKDERGFFAETYKDSDFTKEGIKERFVQENQSRSKKNVLRGLHYQKNPMAQVKLVRCVKGRIFDVAVDIRKNSPTYGKWVGMVLSEEDKKMLYIPQGFAHGFCALEDNSEILYKSGKEYSPQNESGILWNDPDINIIWPIDKPILSQKDSDWPMLKKADNNFIYGE